MTRLRGRGPRDQAPGTLAQRIALLAVAVAVMTAVVAGVLATGLTRQAGERSARQTLSRLADAAQATADIGANAQAGQQRARRTLAAIGVQVATIGPGGRVSSASPVARQALTAAEVADVRARVRCRRAGTWRGRTSSSRRGAPTRAASCSCSPRPTPWRWAMPPSVGRCSPSSSPWSRRPRSAWSSRRGSPAPCAGRRGRAPARRGAARRRRSAGGPGGGRRGGRGSQLPGDRPGPLRGTPAELPLSVSHDLRTPLTAITGTPSPWPRGSWSRRRAPRSGRCSWRGAPPRAPRR